MEHGDQESGVDNISVDPSTSSVNNLILDYYKKFGRKRDLEQFFSLSTAQSEIRDPTGTFWRNMKSQNDSSESGDKKSESSTELCRISIKCSMPEPSSFQQRRYEGHQNSDLESPPIVTEDVAPQTSRNSDEESVKSEDVQSQRSNDAALDTSMNKPPSPTSSITSQRKLEWDSLADVGYGNETDRKTSASSLSTLERLALNQQYSHNDTRHMNLGPPTSHSTPVEVIESKSKGKKGLIKKTTKIHQKDVDLVELNMPHSSQTNLPQAISVNLSKHICFNVEKDGGINIDNIRKEISVSPEKQADISKQTEEKLDKEVQAPLILNKGKESNVKNNATESLSNTQKYPVLISLNSLKKRNRRRKFRIAKKNLMNRNKIKIDTEDLLKSKTTDQVSEAESFEYMPGHIYNQNHLKINQSRGTHAGNKSSLESSAGLTTDSSKGSKHSFSKDLEKSIDLLKSVLQQNNDDSTLKKKLIKEVVQRLIKSKYRDDESSTDFLSGLSFSSKIIGEANHTTTSTSDTNNTREKTKLTKPKKSILQTPKFDSNAIASTSQSAPNLPSVSNSENPVISNLSKPIFLSNTDSEISNKEKHLSDLEMVSSEEFYKKYLEALKREQAHKKHLQDKEIFLKQKLVSSETAIAQLVQADLTTKNKLKSLIKDLTRNNYNDGSGDASKLEGHSNYDTNIDPQILLNNQRSHSVFTLSSGHSDGQSKNPRLKNIIKSAINGSSKAGCSKNDRHYCCCPHHTERAKVGFTDSSVQVNIECNKPTDKSDAEHTLRKNIKCTKCKKESPRNITKVVSDSETGDLKYICVCTDETKSDKCAQNFLVYKCSRLINKSVQLGDSLTRSSSTENELTKDSYTCCDKKKKPKITLKQKVSSISIPQHSKSSQTNVHLNLMVQRKSSVKSISSQSSYSSNEVNVVGSENDGPKLRIQEAIRSVQTDISINPKLSDPSLSDINIIDNKDCVKLVKEQYREVSKTNSENNTVAHISGNKSQVLSSKSSSTLTSKSSVEDEPKKPLDCDCSFIAQLNKEVQSDLGLVDNRQNENLNQFTIPIRGTNMTLKVNLGTTECTKNCDEKCNTGNKSQGVTTERTIVVEQATSLRDDCTKSAQCGNENLFQQFKPDRMKQYNLNENSIEYEELPRSKNKYAVRTCLVDELKSNTYPKKDQDSRRPLLRTNTDISNFENLNPQFDFEKFDNSTNNKEFPNDFQKTDFSKEPNRNQFERETISGNEKNSITNQLINAKKAEQTQKCTTCSDKSDVTNQPTTNYNNFEKCTSCSNENVLIDNSSHNLNQPDKCCLNKKLLVDYPIYKSNNQMQTDEVNEIGVGCSTEKGLLDEPIKPIVQNQMEKCTACTNKKVTKELSRKPNDENRTAMSTDKAVLDEPINLINKNLFETCKSCAKHTDLTDQSKKPGTQNLSNNSSNTDQPDLPVKYHNQNDSKNCQTCSNGIPTTHRENKYKHNFPNKCITCSQQKDLPDLPNKNHKSEMFLTCSSKDSKSEGEASKNVSKRVKYRTQSKTSASESGSHLDYGTHPDPVVEMIENITKRYTKKEIEKNKRKKCFNEIMNVLKYLLDTEEGTDDQNKKSSNDEGSSSDLKQDNKIPVKERVETECCPTKIFVDKAVQLPAQSKLNKRSDSSEIAVTSEFPLTSSDSATCKLLKRIKKECEKYHQRRCKSHNGLKACETSSTTSVNCQQCKRVHHCHCVRHKCKTHKTKTCGETPKKKCIAYNLILQSDSICSEEPVPEMCRPLKSIIVKVPSKRRDAENVPFKEMAAKLERNLPRCSPRSPCRGYRSKSLPNESELSSTEEFLRNPQTYTVREYLERNRPDFVMKSSRRQDCLKTINETRANERTTKRDLLSLQLAKQQTLSALNDEELRHFAKKLSEELRRKKIAPKFISEREMKKHSEKIYKSLPEVTRKKDELRKENIKRTNLLMANIFRKNLQKKTLRGSVNLSNYSTVIKI